MIYKVNVYIKYKVQICTKKDFINILFEKFDINIDKLTEIIHTQVIVGINLINTIRIYFATK